MHTSYPLLTRRLIVTGLIVLFALILVAGLSTQALAAANNIENSMVKGSIAPDAALSGQVTDARTSLPVDGVRVELHTGQFGYTNIDGVYTITVDIGYYTVTASAEYYYTQVITNVYVHGANVVQDFALQHVPVLMSGEVTDANSRLPISDAVISFDTGESVTTDSSGVYTITLPPGVYTATASAEDYAPQTVTGIELIEMPFVQDFELTRQTQVPVTLSGAVTDAYNDTVIEGAKVLLNTGEFDMTNAGGMYMFTLEPGIYTLTVSADGYISQTLAGLELASGNIQQDFALVPPVCPTVDVMTVTFTANALSVSFTASVSSTASLTYLWDFGDGITSTQAAPTHIYDSYGTYTVTVQIANECGQADMWEGKLTNLITLFLPVAIKE